MIKGPIKKPTQFLWTKTKAEYTIVHLNRRSFVRKAKSTSQNMNYNRQTNSKVKLMRYQIKRIEKYRKNQKEIGEAI